jgi:prepilin-type N-terminal cleavage/methylation domain-containing protein
MHRVDRGFTLIEVTIALIVLAIASVGILQGMAAASQNIKEGQTRQYKAALAEARAQALELMDKSLIATTPQIFGTLTNPFPATRPDLMAIGDPACWQLDPTPPSASAPFSTGAFFTQSENGVLTQIPQATYPAGACGDPAIRPGTLCREVCLTQGNPNTGAAWFPVTIPTAYSYTAWTRVVRAGELPIFAVVNREVFVQ